MKNLICHCGKEIANQSYLCIVQFVEKKGSIMAAI